MQPGFYRSDVFQYDNYLSNKCIAGCHIATGTHMPPGRGDPSRIWYSIKRLTHLYTSLGPLCK